MTKEVKEFSTATTAENIENRTRDFQEFLRSLQGSKQANIITDLQYQKYIARYEAILAKYK